MSQENLKLVHIRFNQVSNFLDKAASSTVQVKLKMRIIGQLCKEVQDTLKTDSEQ